MRYHYQRGATRDRRGKIGFAKIAIVGIIGLIGAGYGAFLAALPGLGGWPINRGDETANQVRVTQPGGNGDKIYIPKLNVATTIGTGEASLSGQLGAGKQATISAGKFGIGPTPAQTLAKSPFYRLDKLANGDELFVDLNGTRYAYEVSDDKAAGLELQTSDKSVTIKAKPIGVVAWNGGEPRIETVN